MSNSYGVEVDEKVTQSYVLAQDLSGFEHLGIVILYFLDLVSVKNSFIEIIIKLVLFHWQSLSFILGLRLELKELRLNEVVV